MFIHAFSDSDVMAGNGTIALEVLENIPNVRAIFVPFGGGGLACGIAGVVRSMAPGVRVIACEPETAAPLAASLRKGVATSVVYTPSFVDGAGAPRVYPEMLDLAVQVVDDAVAVPLADVAAAMRLLAERCHVIAEGAGALALAAALRYASDGPVVCVVSGGNIESGWLSTILAGQVPQVG
jgi:threonine dehydratase